MDRDRGTVGGDVGTTGDAGTAGETDRTTSIDVSSAGKGEGARGGGRERTNRFGGTDGVTEADRPIAGIEADVIGASRGAIDRARHRNRGAGSTVGRCIHTAAAVERDRLADADAHAGGSDRAAQGEARNIGDINAIVEEKIIATIAQGESPGVFELNDCANACGVVGPEDVGDPFETDGMTTRSGDQVADGGITGHGDACCLCDRESVEGDRVFADGTAGASINRKTEVGATEVATKADVGTRAVGIDRGTGAVPGGGEFAVRKQGWRTVTKGKGLTGRTDQGTEAGVCVAWERKTIGEGEGVQCGTACTAKGDRAGSVLKGHRIAEDIGGTGETDAVRVG